MFVANKANTTQIASSDYLPPITYYLLPKGFP